MNTQQNLKDSFYLALRDRLALVNPDRTVTVRGATRPAVAVFENEIACADTAVPNCFLLQWDALGVDAHEAMLLLEAHCTIHYSTEGLPELAGMDRGRTLASLDAELAAVLQPAAVQQRSFDGALPAALISNVFWSDPVFAAVVISADRVSRSAGVQVFAWEESL